MKKNNVKLGLLLCIILVLVLTACSGSNNAKDTRNTSKGKVIQKVRFSEVIRSIFYAPHYIAMEKGFFKEEGIEVDLNTAQGSDKGAAALIAGTADISLVGPETTIFIYNQKGDKKLKVFQQLTSTDGSFLMSRNKIDNFKWSDLEGKTVLGWRPGSAPQVVFNSLILKNSINNIEVITNVAAPAMPGAFTSGQGDFIQVFEPVASTLEQSGAAFFVTSIGKEIGNFPETSYVAESVYLEKNPKIIEGWVKAISKASQWIIDNTPEEAAKSLLPYFEGSSEADIINSVKRYKEQDTWVANPEMTEAQFATLQQVLLENELIKEDQKVTIEDITDMTIAKEVGKGVK
ncbi:MAG: ABC transporter substrate-binding protein [Paenibacillaceae bacterium]